MSADDSKNQPTSPKARPCIIVNSYLRRSAKALWRKARSNRAVRSTYRDAFDSAVTLFSKQTRIPDARVRKIAEGELPTAFDIDVMAAGMGWSIAFLFSISKKAIAATANRYFRELGVDDPTSYDKQQFERLYQELYMLNLTSGGDQNE